MDLQATGSGSQWPVCPILVNSSTHACSEFSKLGIWINGMCVKMLTNFTYLAILSLPAILCWPLNSDVDLIFADEAGGEWTWKFWVSEIAPPFVDKLDFIFYICLVLVHFLPSSPFNLNKTAQCHVLCLFILDVTPRDLPPIHPKWHAKEFYRPWATLTAALICHLVTHQECQHITTPTMATVTTHPRLSLTRTSNSGSQIHTTWACLGLKTRLCILLQNSAVVWG